MRVATLPPCLAILAALALAFGCDDVDGPSVENADQVVELGTLDAKADGATLREMSVVVEPGKTRFFRIRATGFGAHLDQSTDQKAQLSAKHYEIDIKGEPAVHPTVEASADGTLRNWTLRVANLGDAQLEGALTVYALEAKPELGIISDIDKTIMPPATDAGLTPPYAGIVTLLNALDVDDGGAPGDVFYVTARSPDRITDVPDYFEEYGLPEGPISTGISGVPWVAQAEKVRDISAILDAHPEQRFVLFGDASHRDPEAYREIMALYPDRIVSAYIHRVKAISDTRGAGLEVFDDYAEVAASLLDLGLIDSTVADAVYKAVDDAL